MKTITKFNKGDVVKVVANNYPYKAMQAMFRKNMITEVIGYLNLKSVLSIHEEGFYWEIIRRHVKVQKATEREEFLYKIFGKPFIMKDG